MNDCLIDIKINGYSASHLPISYEACISSAKSIHSAFKFYKDGSKFGLMDVDKALTDLRKIAFLDICEQEFVKAHFDQITLCLTLSNQVVRCIGSIIN